MFKALAVTSGLAFAAALTLEAVRNKILVVSTVSDEKNLTSQALDDKSRKNQPEVGRPETVDEKARQSETKHSDLELLSAFMENARKIAPTSEVLSDSVLKTGQSFSKKSSTLTQTPPTQKSPSLTQDPPSSTQEIVNDQPIEHKQVFRLTEPKKNFYAKAFTAAWCGNCVQFKKTNGLDNVALLEEPYRIEHIDIDENPSNALVREIRSVPTVVYFNGEKRVHTVVGQHNIVETLEELIQN